MHMVTKVVEGSWGLSSLLYKMGGPLPPISIFATVFSHCKRKLYGLVVPKVESNNILDSHDCNCCSSSPQNAIETVILLPLMTQKISTKFNIIK